VIGSATGAVGAGAVDDGGRPVGPVGPGTVPAPGRVDPAFDGVAVAGSREATPGGASAMPPFADLPTPVPGTLVVRPEGVRIGNGDAPQGVPGTVRAVTLLGAALRVDVELAGGARVLADIAHGGTTLDFRRDDAVSVSFDSARVVFIPD